MSELKYKVGDRVRINSLDWYNENKDEYGNIDINSDFTFYADRSKYCGKVFTIAEVFDNCYTVKEDNNEYYWIDEMIEHLVAARGEDNRSYALGQETHTIPSSELYKNAVESENPHICGNKITLDEYKNNDKEWLFNTLAMLDNITALESIQDIFNHLQKPKYPKTYEECYAILDDTNKINVFDICKFVQLLEARNAYWKIAGEEMGLGKPWSPDYTNTGEKKFSIWVDSDEIKFSGPFTTTQDRKSTRLNSSHKSLSRMPSSA